METLRHKAKISSARNTLYFTFSESFPLEELDAERGRSLYLGEMLLARGIATVKLKRDGKGRQVGKGTMAEGTISPFAATVRIGERVKTYEMGSRNDSRSKGDAAQAAAGWFALEIAREKAQGRAA